MSGTESAATGSTRAEASHRAGEEGNPSFFVSTSVNHRDWVQAEGRTIFSKPSNLRKNFLVAATALGQRKSANPVLWRLRVAGVQRRRGPTGSKRVGEEVLFYIVRQLTLQ